MPKWIRQAGQWLLVGLLVVSMGGHLALLQTVAWGKMMVDFSAGSSLTEAVSKTFDGEHPCEMCKVVKKSKSEEQKKPLLKTELKVDLLLAARVEAPAPRCEDHQVVVPAYDGRCATVSLAVRLRPPRVG